MALQQIDTSSGQVSGVDDLSAASSSVINWAVDEAGVSRPRPGLATHTVTGLGTSPVIGMCRWSAYVILVTQDRKIWAIHDGVPDYAQALSTSSTSTQLEGDDRPTFVAGEFHVYIAGGGRIQRWNTSLFSSELVSASPSCTHIASLGQYLVANDTANPQVYKWSEVGEGAWTSWPAANASRADARPDAIAGIYENTNELYLFGTETLQVYGLGSDPTLPFEIVSTINVGLGASYCVTPLEANFAIFDDTRQCAVTDGRSVEHIGDAIKKDLRGLTTVSDAWCFYEEEGQFSYLVYRFPTERRTFVYDLGAKKWHERKYYQAPFQGDFPVNAYVFWPSQNYHLFASSLSAAGLLRFNASSRQDISGPLVCERTTGWHDFGTPHAKRGGRVRVFMRRGTAAQGATPGALEVRIQRDDGPWSAWKAASAGEPENYRQYVDLWFGGIFRRARYGIRFSTTEDMSLVSIHEDVDALEMAA